MITLNVNVLSTQKKKVVRLNKRASLDFIRYQRDKNANSKKCRENIYHAKRKQKKVGVAVKSIIRDKEGHFIMAKIQFTRKI